VLAVARRPDLFHAYVGAGQMVSESATDRMLYDAVLAHAARTGDTALAERMRGYGPPPYAELTAYAVVQQYYDLLEPYPRTDYFRTQGPAGIDGTGAVEYGPLDKVNKEKALADTFVVLYPQLRDVDFRTQVRRLEVPVYLVAGAHELSARADPAREWFDLLDAPAKEWIGFEQSGHTPQFEQFPRFREEMRRIVAETG
jgi:pimeloyl-ACP methyl ester carboxylesterase